MHASCKTALENHCRFAFETAHPRFGSIVHAARYTVSIVLTVNSGYE